MKKWGGGTKSRGSNTMQCGSGMTSTLRPSLNSKLSFKLVDLTILFSIEHLSILSKLIHCIAICIVNGTVARNSGVAVPTSPTTTSLRAASWSSGTFSIISLSIPSFLFIFMLFFNWCRFTIHPSLITHSRTRPTTHPEVVVSNPTSQTMVTLSRLDFFSCNLLATIWCMWHAWVLCDGYYFLCLNITVMWIWNSYCLFCEFASEAVLFSPIYKKIKFVNFRGSTIADGSYRFPINLRRLAKADGS
jgi:hypothetical protein